MDYKKKFVERRNSQRYKVKNDMIVRIESKLCQLVDINLNGLAFHYYIDGNREGLHGSLELDILLKTNAFIVNNMHSKIISDFVIPNELNPHPIRTRRCSVQFGKLNLEQISRLEGLIRDHTTSNPSPMRDVY
jgi:hypothetical protein